MRVGSWLGSMFAIALAGGCSSEPSGGGGGAGGGGGDGSGGGVVAEGDRRLALFAPHGGHVALLDASGARGDAFMVSPSLRIQSSPIAVAGDFDGDGLDTVSVLESLDGSLHIRNGNGDEDDAAVIAVGPGLVVPVAGDFDGDGIDTVALYSLKTGSFAVLSSNDAEAAREEASIDAPIGLPVAGDFDGDGIDSFGVYDPTGQRFFLQGGEGTIDEVELASSEGAAFAFAGDLDGDGADDVGLLAATGERILVRSTRTGDVSSLDLPASFVWQPLVGRWKEPARLLEHEGPSFEAIAPAEAGFDEAALTAGLDLLAGAKSVRSALVLRHGALVSERHYRETLPTDPQCIKSVSKSLLSALYGIALARGEISLETPVADLLPEYFADLPAEKRDILIGHLLTMSAGLAWEENTSEYMDPFVAADDPIPVVLAQPLVATPGTVLNYNTGLTHIAAVALARATGMSVSQYASEHLFGPLGMAAQRWDHDPLGRDAGGWEVWTTARDMARLGQLYLDRGAFDGVQIVPAEWVDGTTSPFLMDYGALWWTRETNGHPMFYAWGWGGQFIFVVRDLDLVVVVTSDWWDPAAIDAAYAEAFSFLDDVVVPAATP